MRSDRSTPGSDEHALAIALDLTVHELILNKVLTAPTSRGCACCGLTMCVEHAPSGRVPPSVPASAKDKLEWFEYIHEIRPYDISGWVCWRTALPCGCHLHAICLARGPEAKEGEMEATVLATVGATVEATVEATEGGGEAFGEGGTDDSSHLIGNEVEMATLEMACPACRAAVSSVTQTWWYGRSVPQGVGATCPYSTGDI